MRKTIIENKKDFEKFASTITRFNFEENYLKRKLDTYKENEVQLCINGKFDEYNECPLDIGLEDYSSCSNCRICWEKSVKDIYFKDDIENTSLKKSISQLNKVKGITENNNIEYINKDSITYDYDREYSLNEIFEFPDNTEFTFKNEYKLHINNNHILEITDIKDIENNNWYQCSISREWIKGIYKLKQIEKQVTFQEVLESKLNTRIRVEHSLINEVPLKGLDKYLPFEMYMIALMECEELDDYDIKEIIREGNWYLRSEENNYA